MTREEQLRQQVKKAQAQAESQSVGMFTLTPWRIFWIGVAVGMIFTAIEAGRP
jgi:hypothetical protein